jgi:transposase InsO family protein
MYGQVSGPFARFLQENGIVNQYSMSGNPKQNGVAKRHNRTLIDMVRSMLSYSTLQISLWMEALKILLTFLIEYRVSQCLKHRTNYEQVGNPH